MGNWMTKSQNIDDWIKILIDVITGIYYLTGILGKVHPDLHPGNVLILSKKHIVETPLKKLSFQALIHDFGRCYDVNEEVPETFKATLLSFCSEFISCSTRDDLIIPRKILGIIQDIHTMIKNIHIDSNNIKHIYENNIFPILK